ncbi:MAG: abortive infection family protein [Verrucomicrobia bacterium]|nr:abortive infection family protein [Verrucomicrobiota bacterium]
MSQELLSIKTRQVFRENMVGWVLREITDEFDAAKVDCDLSYQPAVSGQRRTLVEQYYRTVDWTDRAQVSRVLQVFENVLHRAEKLGQEATFTPEIQEQRKKEVEKLIHFLQRDGFRWAGSRIVSGAGLPSLASIKDTASVFDAKHMADQIRRMESSVESDPSLAIGTAKELIETCCKTILAERGKQVTGTPDVSTLTNETLKELKLAPEGIPDAARGADVIKRLLSNLGTIGNGLAELRGLYGTGHGKHGSATGLGARHAKLAVGAAATLTVFLFETHKEAKP